MKKIILSSTFLKLNSISILWFVIFTSCFRQIINAQLDSVFNATSAHTSLISGIMISKDQTFFVTASLDSNLKIWNTANYLLKHTQNYPNAVKSINIDSYTNNIYASIQNSDISVLSSTTYSELDASGNNAYPNSGFANSIQFDLTGTNFYMGGQTTNAVSPRIFKFQTTTYNNVGGGSTITTGFGTSTSINCMANMKDIYMAASSNQVSLFQVQLWDLSTNTLADTLTDCQAQVTSLTYDSRLDYLFVTSLDNKIRVYALSSNTNQYQLLYSIDTSSLGTPYGVSSVVKGYLYAIIDNKLVQYTFYADGSINTLSLTNKWYLTSISNVMSISPSGSYILVGCQNGDFNVFKFNIYETHKTIQILIIVGSVVLFVMIMIIIVYFVKCKNRHEDQQKQQQKQMKAQKNIQITQNDINLNVN